MTRGDYGDAPAAGAPPPRQHEVIFDLDAAAFSSDTFRMYEFKVKRCPRVKPHDFAGCPFAHTGEKAKRRDPRLWKYSGTACPEFRRNGCCRRSDACPFAHGIFECWMHPSRYRTQMCSEVLECKRRVCFFAHTEDELRRPVDDTTWMQQHTGGLDVDQFGDRHQGSVATSLHEPYSPYAPGSIKLPAAPGALLAPPSGSGPAAAAPATPTHGGGIPAGTNSAAAAATGPGNSDMWGVLHQMVSNGQLDAAQLLQVVQAMNPQQPSVSTPSRQHSQTLKAAAVPPASPGAPASGSAESLVIATLDEVKSRTVSGGDAPGTAVDGALQVLRAASGGPASPDAALSGGGAVAGGAVGGGQAPGVGAASEGKSEAASPGGGAVATQASTAAPSPAADATHAVGAAPTAAAAAAAGLGVSGGSGDPQAAVLEVLQRLELVNAGHAKLPAAAQDAEGAPALREAAEQQ